jgi:hypothetical protein
MRNDLTQTVFGDLLNKKFTLADTLAMLDKMDLLQNGQLAELAISKTSGIAMCGKLTKNIDLVTGKQIKHARTHLRPTGSWVATISRNTTAPMLVVIAETNTNKNYYLHIPYKAHSHLLGNTIGINFGSDGNRLDNHWLSSHKVDNYNEFCELAK